MYLISNIFKQYHTISIVGLAKNVGKTTTLNYLVEEALKINIPLGLTSTGRDGEKIDVVTATEKPSIYVAEGMIITTATKIFEESDAGLEILKITDFSTPLGNIMICRVRECGNVEISGPTNAKDIKEICGEILSFGAEAVLVDGSIDRKASASPLISDATILATGAVLSRDMNIVVEETAHVVELYGLKTLDDKKARDIILNEGNEDKIFCIKDTYEALEINLNTGIANSKYINQYLTEDVRYIYFPGALTYSAISNIDVKKLKNVEIVVKDSTKVFIDSMNWQNLKRHSINIKVLNPMNLIAVTLNSFSPKGYQFDPNTFFQKMKKSIQSVEVMDIFYGGGV